MTKKQLINFYESQLEGMVMLSPSLVFIIEQTIRKLKELPDD